MNDPVYIGPDRAFPIYRIYATWQQWSDKFEDDWSDLPGRWAWLGCVGNSWSTYRMLRRDPQSADDLETLARSVWRDARFSDKYEGITTVDLRIEFVRYETWCLHWFNHWTWDLGQTDYEILASFERYVQRYEYMQEFPSSYSGNRNYICLMGAEDRFRWKGPCFCIHCNRMGKVSIDH